MRVSFCSKGMPDERSVHPHRYFAACFLLGLLSSARFFSWETDVSGVSICRTVGVTSTSSWLVLESDSTLECSEKRPPNSCTLILIAQISFCLETPGNLPTNPRILPASALPLYHPSDSAPAAAETNKTTREVAPARASWDTTCCPFN
jgi:hypothetical protein